MERYKIATNIGEITFGEGFGNCPWPFSAHPPTPDVAAKKTHCMQSAPFLLSTLLTASHGKSVRW